MARKLRNDFPGAWHHVMNRGSRREAIFLYDEHCEAFLEVVGETVDRFDIEVHGYALLPNHYHLLIRSPHGNISRAMRHIGGVYTLRFNRLRGVDGSLFRGRFRSQLVRQERHLRCLLAYLHLNPVRAGLVRRPEEPCWTSHREYLGLDAKRRWMSTSFYTALFGGVDGVKEVVDAYRKHANGWPDGFDQSTGWLRTGDAGPSPYVLRDQPLPPQPPIRTKMTPDAVLEIVCQIASVPHARLLEVERGPRANPARRFAVWALAQLTDEPHGGIGQQLDMTRQQVSRLLTRLRLHLSPPLDGWALELDERVSMES
jgi:putative transposase